MEIQKTQKDKINFASKEINLLNSIDKATALKLIYNLKEKLVFKLLEDYLNKFTLAELNEIENNILKKI